MNINKMLNGEENKKNKNKVKLLNKSIEGRVCHDRISILPVLINHHGSVKTYVEIGTLHGGSMSLVIQEKIADSLFIGIDLFEYTNFGENPKKIDPKGFIVDESIARKNIDSNNNDNQFFLIKGDSRSKNTIDSFKKILNGRLVDFLFVDGLHTKEGVVSDFENYKVFLNEGAYVVFDDYNDHKGVREGVMSIIKDIDGFEIVGNFDNEFLIIKK